GAMMVAEAAIGGSVNGALSKSTLASLTEFSDPRLVKVSPPSVTTPTRSLPLHLPKKWVWAPGLRQHCGPAAPRRTPPIKENPFVPKSVSGPAPVPKSGLKLKEPDVMIVTIESACAGATGHHTISATARARRHETWGSRPRFAMLWTLIVFS